MKVEKEAEFFFGLGQYGLGTVHTPTQMITHPSNLPITLCSPVNTYSDGGGSVANPVATMKCIKW